jgi:phosphoribosylglycinamide formyltransferase-1
VSVRIAVLVSGSGTNLQAILDAVTSGALRAEVALVLSNKAGVKALERAAAAGVPTVVLSHKSFATREDFDAEVVRELRARGVELVVLAGFMRIVTTTLLDAFPDRVINIHPSLLPSFPGVDAQAQALRAGVAIAGCTVHLVDGGMDSGAILAQAAVPVVVGDDEEALRHRILAQEHRLFPAVLQWFVEGRVRVQTDAAGKKSVQIAGKSRALFGAAEGLEA